MDDQSVSTHRMVISAMIKTRKKIASAENGVPGRSNAVAKNPATTIPACRTILCQGSRETAPYRQDRRLSRCHLAIALALPTFLPGCWKDRDEELLHQAVAVG